MINLSRFAGIEARLDKNQLLLEESLKKSSATRTRMVSDLADVWRKEGITGQEPVYSTILGLIREGDREIFSELNIEHGIVLMQPGCQEDEYHKLIGHYHENESPGLLPSPEIHCVLSGQGFFLLQKSFPPYGKMLDIVLIEAQAGDMFFIPPWYGHIAINTSNEPLVFNGFYHAGMKANYGSYKANRGGAYYLIRNDQNIAETIPNPRYGEIPSIRKFSAVDLPKPDWLNQFSSCYEAISKKPEEFGFFNQPEAFRKEWFF